MTFAPGCLAANRTASASDDLVIFVPPGNCTVNRFLPRSLQAHAN